MTYGPFRFTPPPNPPPPPPAFATGQAAPNGLVAGGSGVAPDPVSGAPACPAVPLCPALPAPPARPARPSAGGGAGFGCTRRSQQAIWMPALLLLASGVPEISRTSRPAASVIRSFTSPTGFLLSHETIAAPGGCSPKNVWSPQNS